MRRGKWTCIDLDAVGAELRGAGNMPDTGVNKETDSTIMLLEPVDEFGQFRTIPFQIETMIGGELPIAVRNQGHLFRLRLAHQFQKTRVAIARGGEGVSLDIQLGTRQHIRQAQDINGTNVALVRARMNGYAVTARSKRNAGSLQRIGKQTATGVPQHSHLVDVDAESSHDTDPGK